MDIARKCLEVAQRTARDVVIVDTAGRLSIDEALMAADRGPRRRRRSVETLLVVDAMTGRERPSALAQRSTAAVPLTPRPGLTKIDGDARGGAALSISAVTGLPVKFLGTGEKTDALEVFHPTGWPGGSWAWATC